MRLLFLCLTLLFIVNVNNTNAQTVSTHSGIHYIGSGNYTGYRNNIKDSVYFSAPMGIAVDTAGRVYVSNEHNIFWLNGNTAYLAAGYNLDPTTAGAADSKDFAGIVARFARPAGLAVNPSTNELIVADLENNQIRKVEKFINLSTQQQVNTLAGVRYFSGANHADGATNTARFSGPADVAVASNGDIYVADRNNHCIRKIVGNTVTTIAGKAGVSGNTNGNGTNARFAAPYAVFLDGNSLFVADYGNSAIRKINLSTNDVTDFITSGLFGPKDICKVGNAYFIAEALCIKKFESSVLSLYVGNANVNGYINDAGTAARFEDISSIVYHPKQNLIYVVDMGNNVVRTVSPNLKPIANFTASTTSATRGQTIILSSTSTNIPTAFKWSITPSSTYTLLNNSTLNDSIVYISFGQTGTYTVKLLVSNSSGSDSLTKNNYLAISSVTAIPVANFSVSKSSPALNETIDLIDLSANGPTSWKWVITPATYQWMNGTDSSSQFPKVKFTADGQYTIALSATNVQGTHSVQKANIVTVAPSNVNAINKSIFTRIYPNPSSDNVIVISNETINYIAIYNLKGQLLVEEFSNTNLININVAELENGYYYAVLKTQNGIVTHKLSVQH